MLEALPSSDLRSGYKHMANHAAPFLFGDVFAAVLGAEAIASAKL